MIWNKARVTSIEAWADSYSASLVATYKGEVQRWIVTGVYGPVGGVNLGVFLDELDGIRRGWDLPWCIGGDFNEVLYLEERNRATRRTQGIDEFCDFVDRNELVNVPISGARFTWCNFQGDPALSKLDKFLVSGEWEDLFSHMCVCALPRPGSNHTPLMLKGGDFHSNSGPRPFRFQNMWLLHPRFVDIIRNWWDDLEVWGPPGQIFRLKLKSIRDKLRI